jgi:hypothetical protein
LSCSATAPANPVGHGGGCTSPANICGQTYSGTRICSGGSDTLYCSTATAPPDSNCNLCGVLNPVTSTRRCEAWETAVSCPTDCAPVASCAITVKPKVVISGNKATVTFNVPRAHVCTLRRYGATGTLQSTNVYNTVPAATATVVGGSGVTGTYTSPALTEKTTFTLTCSNAVTASCVSPSQVIRVVPPPKIREL